MADRSLHEINRFRLFSRRLFDDLSDALLCLALKYQLRSQEKSGRWLALALARTPAACRALALMNAWNAVKSHLTRAPGRGEGSRVRRVRGGGSGGSGGSFERIRGRGKTRLRDRAPLLQRQQDVSRSPLTHDLSDVTAHWPRPAPHCTLRAVCTALLHRTLPPITAKDDEWGIKWMWLSLRGHNTEQTLEGIMTSAVPGFEWKAWGYSGSCWTYSTPTKSQAKYVLNS